MPHEPRRRPLRHAEPLGPRPWYVIAGDGRVAFGLAEGRGQAEVAGAKALGVAWCTCRAYRFYGDPAPYLKPNP